MASASGDHPGASSTPDPEGSALKTRFLFGTRRTDQDNFFRDSHKAMPMDSSVLVAVSHRCVRTAKVAAGLGPRSGTLGQAVWVMAGDGRTGGWGEATRLGEGAG